MIKGSIKGFKNLQKKLDGAKAEMLEAQVEAVKLSTLALYSEAVKLIQSNSDGTPEIRYGPKRVVAVSKPGEAPNTDTGRLVQSIKFDFQKQGLVGRVGSNLRYAAHLEFGTSEMAPRPWLSTAVENTSDEVAEIFQKCTSDSIKRLVKL